MGRELESISSKAIGTGKLSQAARRADTLLDVTMQGSVEISGVRWCRVCGNLNPNSPVRTWPILGNRRFKVNQSSSLPPFNDFRSRASECPFCFVLVSYLSKIDNEYFTKSLDIGRVEINIRDLSVTVTMYKDRSWLTEHMQIYAPSDRPSNWPWVPSLREIGKSSSSEECMTFLKSCLGECIRSHTSCVGNDPKYLPTRLVDVGEDKDTMIRLLETDKAMHAPQLYAALSYCWGIKPFFRATKESLPKLMQGLSVLLLPQTIRDAIHITRSLRLRYLWVDSLCIIQEDPEDWQREAQQMAFLYRNAHITIAASSASSTLDGFLKERELASDPFSHSWTSDGEHHTLRARPLLSCGLHSPSTNCLDPLQLRGWAFQEQILSSRYISFSTGELQWICQETVSCECGRLGSQSGAKFGEGDDSDDHGDRTTFTHNSQLREGALGIWEDLVQDYTARKLSFPKDKFMAISGVARVLQEKTRYDYTSGIWMHAPTLSQQLGWFVSSRTAKPDSRAPSFSWASVDSGVKYKKPDAYVGPADPAGLALLDWNPRQNTDDALTYDGPATLTITGQVFKAKLSLVEESTLAIDLETRCKIQFFDPVLDAPLATVQLDMSEGALQLTACRSHVIRDIKTELRVGIRIWALCLERRKWFFGRRIWAFLLLGRLPQETTQWQRIGFASLYDRGGETSEEWADELMHERYIETVTLV